MAYATVLVGTDGSESSFLAVERAAELSQQVGARLILLCAYHPMTAREQSAATAALGEDAFRVSGTSPAEEALAAATRHAREAGAAEVDGRIAEGDAVDQLLSVAEAESVDVIVIGNRGINTLSGRLLGSVPSDVSHRAPCDVLIVHTTSGRRR